MQIRADWEITPREVKRMIDAGEEVVLIDCRTPQEHAIARIEGSELLPLQELPARLDELDEERDKKVVVYCHHGIRSLQMAAILRERGFEDVRSLAGGIDAWSMQVDAGVPRY